MGITKIVSSGKAGVERMALQLAVEQKMNFGGCYANARNACKDKLPGKYTRYNMYELGKGGFGNAIQANVNDSDATLIFCYGTQSKWMDFAKAAAEAQGKACLVMDLAQTLIYRRVELLKRWLAANKVMVLHVTGTEHKHDALCARIAKDVLVDCVN